MQSRLDKYDTSQGKKYERLKKNTQLYEEVYDDIYRDTTYKNMEVIDSAKEINLNRLKDILDDKYDTRQYRTLNNYSGVDLDEVNKMNFSKRTEKLHDINEIINEAKSKRAFIEEAKEKQKYMEFTDGRNKKYSNRYDEMEKEEQELEDLINTMAIEKQDSQSDTNSALDMFSELKGSENTIVTNPIETSFDTTKEDLKERTKTSDLRNDLEKTLIKADKNFYTDSNMFTKNDFEDFSTLTKQLKRKNRKKNVAIIVVCLLVICLIGYFVLTKFVLK